jgi:curved DNA-binding protein CbpA
MATLAEWKAWVQTVHRKNYYEILRVKLESTDSEIKAAFHAFALRFHPDRLVDDGPEVATLAAEIFKRGVEAYNILTRPEHRKRYDEGLRKGRIRLDPTSRPSSPPPPKIRTLEMIAKTPGGKKFAAKADRLIAIGKLEDARVALTSAFQCEPMNDELEERIDLLYEALALEPGG